MWKQRKSKKGGGDDSNVFDSDILENMPEVDTLLEEADAALAREKREEEERKQKQKEKEKQKKKKEKKRNTGGCGCW